MEQLYQFISDSWDGCASGTLPYKQITKSWLCLCICACSYLCMCVSVFYNVCFHSWLKSRAIQGCAQIFAEGSGDTASQTFFLMSEIYRICNVKILNWSLVFSFITLQLLGCQTIRPTWKIIQGCIKKSLGYSPGFPHQAMPMPESIFRFKPTLQMLKSLQAMFQCLCDALD